MAQQSPAVSVEPIGGDRVQVAHLTTFLSTRFDGNVHPLLLRCHEFTRSRDVKARTADQHMRRRDHAAGRGRLALRGLTPRAPRKELLDPPAVGARTGRRGRARSSGGHPPPSSARDIAF